MDSITITVNTFLYLFVPLVFISLITIAFNLLLKILYGVYLMLAALLLAVGLNLLPHSTPQSKRCPFFD
jgi:hypothetical protein